MQASTKAGVWGANGNNFKQARIVMRAMVATSSIYMYIYIHKWMHMDMYVHICICIHTYTYMYICNINMYTCMTSQPLRLRPIYAQRSEKMTQHPELDDSGSVF